MATIGLLSNLLSAKFMIPKHIVFLDQLPRTSTGKPEKGKLSSYWAAS